MFRTVELGEILRVRNGFAFKSELFCEKSRGVPLVRIRDIKKGKTELNYDGVYRNEFLVSRGDMLIGMDGDFECVIWQGEQALLNQRVCRLEGFSTDVLPSFVYYSIQSKLAEIHSTTAFVTVKHISSKQIAEIKIPLPPLDEQQRIVDILDRAASIQRLRQAADEKLKQIIPALFVDMFGDPANNPKGWPMATIGDLIESADYGSSSKAHDEATGLPMLRMGNVTMDGALDLKNLKYVEFEPSELAKFKLRKGDILFNRTNSKELVGKTGIWDGSYDAVYASYFIRLRTKTDKMTPEVLWAFMNSKHTKGLLYGMARGAIGQSNINSKELRAIRLFVPPIALQERFSQLYYDLKAKVAMSTGATASATSIAASLASEVFFAA